MKQKLALCCALVHKPEILLLDEPTTGVDAVSRKEFWDMLKKLKLQGITILVSTPYMDEANLCERIAMIQNGRIMSVDTPENIIRSYPVKLYAAKAADIYRLLKDFRSQDEIESCYPFGEYLHITLKNQQEPALEFLKRLAIMNRHPDIETKEIVPGIEDCFIRLMTKQQEHPANEPLPVK
jgi:ABC-type multidrug transport system ATPase subunit